MLITAYWVLTCLMISATVLPLSHMGAWWIRDLDFPRLHFVIISFIVGIAACLTLDISHIYTKLIIAIHIICFSYHAYWILPYTIFFPKSVAKSKYDNTKNSISLFSSNVLTPNKNTQALKDLIAEYKPNILVTLETDKRWQAALDELKVDYPYTVACPQDNLYGMHVYSNLPLENTRIEFLIEDNIPSIHACIKHPSGAKIRAHFLHPAPPSPTENASSSERDAELIVVAKSLASDDGPIIVTGDLNDVAWSKSTQIFRRLSNLQDPRIGRGMFNTFHADHWFLRWPLDHIFHSKHFTVEEIKRVYLEGSDHFALYSRLQLEVNPNESTPINTEVTEDDRELIKRRETEQNSANKKVHNPT